MMKYCSRIIVLVSLLYLAGCVPIEMPLPTVPTESDVLVSGNIIHIKNAPFSYQGDFIFAEGSHAVVELHYMQGADSASEIVVSKSFEAITAFPIQYQLEGNAQEVFARQGDYFLQVKVLQDAGDEVFVGDLLNEFFTPVSRVGAVVRVEVTGLELCSSEGAGGFCTNKQR